MSNFETDLELKNLYPEIMDVIKKDPNGLHCYFDIYKAILLDFRENLSVAWEDEIRERFEDALGRFISENHFRWKKAIYDPDFLAPTYSCESILLESLNLCLNIFDTHFIDRELKLTGQHIIYVTCGRTNFWANKVLSKLTKHRMLQNSIGCTIISMGAEPRFKAPLFTIVNDGETRTEAKKRSELKSPQYFLVGFPFPQDYSAHDTELSNMKRPDPMAFTNGKEPESFQLRIFTECDHEQLEPMTNRLIPSPDDFGEYCQHVAEIYFERLKEQQKIVAEANNIHPLFDPNIVDEPEYRDRKSYNRRRWAHLYSRNMRLELQAQSPDEYYGHGTWPSAPPPKDAFPRRNVYWQVLMSPATLPLTTEYYPGGSLEAANQFGKEVEQSYLAPAADNIYDLLKEMVGQRLSNNYQILLNEDSSVEEINQALDSSSDNPISTPDRVMFLSIGHTVQRLSVFQDEKKIVKAVFREKSWAEKSNIPPVQYNYLLFDHITETYAKQDTTFTLDEQTDAFSEVDRILFERPETEDASRIPRCRTVQFAVIVSKEFRSTVDEVALFNHKWKSFQRFCTEEIMIPEHMYELDLFQHGKETAESELHVATLHRNAKEWAQICYSKCFGSVKALMIEVRWMFATSIFILEIRNLILDLASASFVSVHSLTRALKSFLPLYYIPFGTEFTNREDATEKVRLLIDEMKKPDKGLDLPIYEDDWIYYVPPNPYPKLTFSFIFKTRGFRIHIRPEELDILVIPTFGNRYSCCSDEPKKKFITKLKTGIKSLISSKNVQLG